MALGFTPRVIRLAKLFFKDKPYQPDKYASAYYRDDKPRDKAVSGKADKSRNPAAENRTYDTDNNVAKKTALALHNNACKPTYDTADDDINNYTP